jgi:CubicO group peptidase (beta-lactamase class C family)
LKTIINLFLLTLFFCSCNSSSRDKKPVDNSPHNILPAPKKLDPREFDYYSRTVSDFFEHHLLHKGFNGAILVAKNGSIVYEKYVGYRDLRKKDSLTDTTPIHIASTGKTFTAMAILQMVQEKKLSLSDSLTKFFPGLPYPGRTIKMLLNHRSGLPNYVYFIPNSGWDTLPAVKAGNKYVTNKDVLNLLYTLQPKQTYLPNTHFSYSNTNFVLLALIIEKLSGKSFPEYMKEKFFDPLQMKNTYIFTMADSLKATPSFNYDGSFWPYDMLEGTYGDKNVYTTPRDLLKWDQALYTEQIINKAMLDSAFTPYSQERASMHNYGLGWRLLILPNSKKIIYHFGRWHGFNAAFARLTGDSATIIILGNRFTRSIYNSAHKAYDIFGDYQQHLNGEEEETDNGETSSKSAAPKYKSKKIYRHTQTKARTRR